MNYLVTGCSRGVGLEICRVLLEQGHTVYGVARSYTDEFKKLESEFDNKLFFKSIDLGDSENVHRNVFKDFVNNRIQLHGYVNNAAMAYDDIVTNLKLDRLQSMYSVNVFTPMMITKYVLRNMLLHHTKGSIVHISSISAHTGYKGLAMYASSKGALEAFSKDTAREWGELGIRSNVVVPGFMETAMSATLTEEQKNRIYKRTSMKAATSVRSVAETVAFLLSDGACSITHPQIEAAQIYIFVNNYISEYLAADNIFYKNKALTDICGLLDEFYDLDNLHYIYGKLAVGDTSDEKVEQIYKNMDAILKTYFYVSDEQVQAIRTADSTQIQLIIEESVKNKYE